MAKKQGTRDRALRRVRGPWAGVSVHPELPIPDAKPILQMGDALRTAILGAHAHVEHYEQLAARESARGREVLSEIRRLTGRHMSRLTTFEFVRDAAILMDVLARAFYTGDPSDVHALAKHFSTTRAEDPRRKKEWVRRCDSFLRTSLAVSRTDESESLLRGAFSTFAFKALMEEPAARAEPSVLIAQLREIDENAAALTVEKVRAHVETYCVPSLKTRGASPYQQPIRSPGFAAALACDCRACGYKPGEQEKARKAFEAALGDRERPSATSGS